MSRKRRAKTEVKNSGYSDGGASQKSNILKSYYPKKLSSKSDIDRNLKLLRNRSSDEAINTPVGAAAINTSATHTVGSGLNLFPRPDHKALGITPQEAIQWRARVRGEFKVWANSKHCDLYKRNNFYDIQHIAYISYLIDGDSFLLFRRQLPSKMFPYSLRLQLLEANRVSNPNSVGAMGGYSVDMKAPNSNNRIISGVEIDSDGATTAYWVSNKVPDDYMDNLNGVTTWVRVKAFGDTMGEPNILQVCHDIRADQYRGVPYLAPVIETLKQVSRFTGAELASAIVKSFFALFFTETSGISSMEDILGASAQETERIPVVDVSEYALGPGTMNALPKGVDVKSIDSSNSQSTFSAFVSEMIKQIAAAIGQPYEVLMKHFTSSYSASRAALLQAWDEYKMRRVWFARDFCQPVYEAWLTESVAIGRIEAPGFFDDPLIRAAWCNAEWFGPAMNILDPVKDIKGAALRIQNGLSTYEREAAEMTGSDIEENLEQQAYEIELSKRLDIPIRTY